MDEDVGSAALTPGVWVPRTVHERVWAERGAVPCTPETSRAFRLRHHDGGTISSLTRSSLVGATSIAAEHDCDAVYSLLHARNSTDSWCLHWLGPKDGARLI